MEVRRSRTCGGAAFTYLWRCGVQFAFKRGKKLLLSPRGLAGGGLLSLLNNNNTTCARACARFRIQPNAEVKVKESPKKKSCARVTVLLRHVYTTLL
ncbi:hypothetical protein EYF80_055674 [Liparis tanakae]|uniref:Uncharacterized protein n=1 Tax=Liparis tanakae TaxID=230148 RepID=A0A4Z2EYV8_9TELE|nr:hypothetical protein EYF80_055674 [Liparis tanakae]